MLHALHCVPLRCARAKVMAGYNVDACPFSYIWSYHPCMACLTVSAASSKYMMQRPRNKSHVHTFPPDASPLQARICRMLGDEGI